MHTRDHESCVWESKDGRGLRATDKLKAAVGFVYQFGVRLEVGKPPKVGHDNRWPGRTFHA